MSSVVISGDTSGQVTLSAPAVAGTNTITLQAATGTLAFLSDGLGYSQTWQTVTRTSGTTYYNTTGKPIVVNRSFTAFINAISRCTVSINGGTGFYILATEGSSTTNRSDAAGSVIIPPNASYVFTDEGTPGTVTTTELR